MRRVFLVSCTKSKRAEPMAARDLYMASPWFTKARAYVEAHGDVDWYILSAEHGLLHPDEVVAPYETTLLKMGADARKAWAQKVWAQLHARKVGCRGFVFLAGERYREHLEGWATLGGRDVHGAEVPMRGLEIGEQLAWLGSATVLPLEVDEEWSLRSSFGDGDVDVTHQDCLDANLTLLRAGKGPAAQKARAKLQSAMKRSAAANADYEARRPALEPLPVRAPLADPFAQAERENHAGVMLSKLADELRQRQARRANNPMPVGSLFDDVTRSQLELF